MVEQISVTYLTGTLGRPGWDDLFLPILSLQEKKKITLIRLLRYARDEKRF